MPDGTANKLLLFLQTCVDLDIRWYDSGRTIRSLHRHPSPAGRRVEDQSCIESCMDVHVAIWAARAGLPRYAG